MSLGRRPSVGVGVVDLLSYARLKYCTALYLRLDSTLYAWTGRKRRRVDLFEHLRGGFQHQRGRVVAHRRWQLSVMGHRVENALVLFHPLFFGQVVEITKAEAGHDPTSLGEVISLVHMAYLISAVSAVSPIGGRGSGRVEGSAPTPPPLPLLPTRFHATVQEDTPGPV